MRIRGRNPRREQGRPGTIHSRKGRMRMKGVRGWCRAALFMLLLAVMLPIPLAAAQTVETGKEKPVYVIPAEQAIERGLQKFLERAYKEAEEGQAAYVILDLDTLGGRVDAALEIGELIRESKIPTAVQIRGKAISAGSYIALNANKIYMQKGSSIGAAAVVDGSGEEVESAKVIAFWAGEMRGAAELRGRNPQIAEGMVNKNLELTVPELNKTYTKGELVSLTAEQALKTGFADGLAESHEEILKALGLEQAPLVTVEPTAAERLARFLTNPYVMTILFMLGLAGIAIELFVPGFGLPGIIGVGSFVSYFFGHYVAGFAGVEDVALFALGIVLLIVEIFVPGFGIWALAGIVSLMSGAILAAYDSGEAAVSLAVGFVLAAVLAGTFIYIFRRRGIWNKFILRDELKTELGYISQPAKDHLVGRTGTTLTPLRPAGTAVIAGERYDVVTEGEFIGHKVPVVVVKVEGVRIVVREAAGADNRQEEGK